ncbi:MAG TPA: hypothetical protein VFD57_01800 [Clostridia bacterium]|nr:hypothetical protein [Clostridia bacterium]
MVNTRKRIYTIGLVILTLVLLGSGIWIWNFIGNYGKQQDKTYSGAKLVRSTDEAVFKDDYVC